MLSLKDFMKASIKNESKNAVIGGGDLMPPFDVRPYIDSGLYHVRIWGSGPYTTYIDGMFESDNDVW